MKPKLLDTYCKAGGAGYGFSLAGFDVVGVDKEPQPNYPFKFYQGDAVEFIAKFGCDFDHIHSSPPCQFASVLTPMEHRSKHKNWIPETREALIATGKLYDIENVENARRYLINPIMLCGSMFGLGVWRHRYFELHPSISLLTRLAIMEISLCLSAARAAEIMTGSSSRRNNAVTHQGCFG
jgi:DNA (cytosine-5)-methyltransferase 1